MRTDLIQDPKELSDLTPEWERLLAQSSTNEPVLSPLWLKTWWDVFGALDGRQLSMLRVQTEHNELIGLVPLLRRTHLYGGVLPFHRYEWMGSGESEADEICSDYLGAICLRGHEERVAREMASYLLSCDGWDELVLPEMDGDNAFCQALCDRLSGELEIERHEKTSPHIPLPSSMSDYLLKLPRKSRYYAKKDLSSFEDWAQGTAKYIHATCEKSLEEGWQVLKHLHTARWEADGKSGVFASERFTRFHDSIREELFSRGALELIWLEAHGRPIAATYNILWNSKVYFYQCGRATDLPDEVRPGTVLQLYAIERAIERGDREYDLLPGEQLYKRRLSLATRPLVRLRAIKSRLRERVRQTLSQTVNRARTALVSLFPHAHAVL